MTLKEIKEMINLMEEYGLSELEVEKEGLKIRLKRGPSGKVVSEMASIASPAPSHAASHIPPVGQQTARETAEEANVFMIRSPMVGTFYTAPAPDAAPYVTSSKRVAEGDVLCIIEAMKLMNEIKSDCDGEVSAVYVKNGQAVQFGERLFAIKVQ